MAKRLNWIASWPKAGNIWITMFLLAYHHGPNWYGSKNSLLFFVDNDPEIYQSCCNLPLEELDINQMLGLRTWVLEQIVRKCGKEDAFIKTHCADGLLKGHIMIPHELTRSAIVLVRDPRSCAASFAKWLKIPTDRMIEMMNKDNCPLADNNIYETIGSWSSFYKSWTQHTKPFPTLILKYEDLHSHPVSQFRAILKHLNMPFNKTRFNFALEETTFASLKAYGQSSEDQEAKVEHAWGSEQIRKGEVGGWINELTPAQAARIEKDHAEMMEYFHYD